MITKETIMEAYLFLRKENQSVPSETLEFMKDTALAELQKSEVKNLGIHGVSFNEDCECKNDEVCGLCFRKKGYEMIDNELKLTGEVEVCDKCEREFSYTGEYRNICWECEHDYI